MARLAVRSNQISGHKSLAVPRFKRMKSTQYGCYESSHSHEQNISAFRTDQLGKGAPRSALAVCLERDAGGCDGTARRKPSRTRLEFRLAASLDADGGS